MTKNIKSFTILELMVVVIIMGVLAFAAIPLFTLTMAQSRANTMEMAARGMHAAAEMYNVKNQGYYQNTGWLFIDAFNAAHNVNIVQDTGMTFRYRTDAPAPANGFMAETIWNQGGGNEFTIRITSDPLSNSNPCCSPSNCTPNLQDC